MSKKGLSYRKERERKKKEARKAELAKREADSHYSLDKVIKDLKAIFNEDTVRALSLANNRGLSNEQIAEQLGVGVDRVVKLRESVERLPPAIRDRLLSNPAVLHNPLILEYALEQVARMR